MSEETGKSVMRIMSEVIERTKLAIRAGLSFEGARDYYKILGYRRQLQAVDLLSKYTRQDIAGRIIDAPANSTWIAPPRFSDEGFQTAMEELDKRILVWNSLNRADRMANMAEYSLLIVGFADGGGFEKPLRSGAHEAIYIRPIFQTGVSIKEVETDPRSPRFGMPVVYQVDFDDLSSKEGGTMGRDSRKRVLRQVNIHHSRVVHVAFNPLNDSIYGEPMLKRVCNLLDDIQKVAGGSAETFWMTANRGLQADIDKEMDLDVEDAKRLEDMFDEYQHQLRRVLRTRGVEVKELGSDTVDPSGAFGVLLSLLAGATGIPQRILLGAEAGQLASEQDRANWARNIKERRTFFAEPLVLRPFIQLMQATGNLPESYGKIEWDSAFNMSPLEEDQSRAQFARSIVNMSRDADSGEPIATLTEKRAVLGLPEATPEQLAEFEEMRKRAKKGQATPEEQAALDAEAAKNLPSDGPRVPGQPNNGEATS